jgi:hypothetical protein
MQGLGLTGPTVQIGKYEYRVTLLSVEQGHTLRWELIALVGEPLLQSVAKVIETGDVTGLNIEDTLRSLAALFQRLDPRFVYRLQETFVGATEYRGGGEWTKLANTWNQHFAGKYHELDALTWVHLKVNYLSFLDDSDVWQNLYRVGSQVLSAVKSRHTSPSTGTSGESSVAAS